MPIKRVGQPRTLEPCAGCGELIYRNLAFFNGRPWHYGELNETGKLSEATHYCYSCRSYLTPDQVVRVHGLDGRSWDTCGLCGGSSINRLGKESGKATVFQP